MTQAIKYFDKLIQSKLEQLPRAIKGGASKEVLEQILLEMEWLQKAKKLLLVQGDTISVARAELYGKHQHHVGTQQKTLISLKDWRQD